MRRTLIILLFFALCFPFFLTGPACAITPGDDDYFDLKINCPVSVRVGTGLIVKLIIRNTDSQTRYLSSVQAVIIDPWTGMRIFGPKNYPIDKALKGEEYQCTQTGCTKIPGGYVSKSLSITIPAMVDNVAMANKTLGLLVYALDDAATVRGIIGWAFVAIP